MVVMRRPPSETSSVMASSPQGIPGGRTLTGSATGVFSVVENESPPGRVSALTMARNDRAYLAGLGL